MTIYDKLLEVQQELKAPKNQYNSFGKFNYRSCEDILEALKPILVSKNLLLTLSDDVVSLDEVQFIKSKATLVNLDDTKEEISVTACAGHALNKKGMDLSQITGASSSYARKYALNGLFLIDDSKDADSQEQPIQQTSSGRFDKLSALTEQAVSKGIDKGSIAKWFSKEYGHELKDATNNEIRHAEDYVSALIEKAK